MTGGRAEYDLLSGVMAGIRDSSRLRLQTVVTGAHLVAASGHTVDSIVADGFDIDATIDMVLANDAPVAVAKSVGIAMMGFADAFARLRPDILLVLGDRYEILAAATAAMMMGIPIAHVHGGERSDGAIDESIRHAVTKMAYLHFVAAEPYRRRVIQMGESPERVVLVGAPGIDNVLAGPHLERADLERALGRTLGDVNFLVTYHPATRGEIESSTAVRELLSALDGFPSASAFLTGANADAGGSAINAALRQYALDHPERVSYTPSLGRLRYLSLLRVADVVIGNSSSGLIEAPVFGVPTVNVGSRQDGRLKADSIIDCEESASQIQASVSRALTPEFRAMARAVPSLYAGGEAVNAIVRHLEIFDVDAPLAKSFVDIPDCLK